MGRENKARRELVCVGVRVEITDNVFLFTKEGSKMLVGN